MRVDQLTSATTAQLRPSTAASKPQPSKELGEALEEFEALFASTLLRTAREENGKGWLGAESSAGSDGIMDFAEQHIAKSMAKQGAFGIAKTVAKSLHR
jgi:Rod binding domain-containing protein